MGRVVGKVAPVTGAASGIGAATVASLRKVGARCCAAALVGEFGVMADGVGRLDAVVHSAGVAGGAGVAGIGGWDHGVTSLLGLA